MVEPHVTSTAASTPVTIVSGMKGAGKTTLITHLARAGSAPRIGVISDNPGGGLDAAPRETISGGCMCCAAKSALLDAVNALSERRDCDHIVVEASPSAVPRSLSSLFTESSARFQSYRVQSLITVIDASTFLDELREARDLAEIDPDVHPDDDRSVADVLIEQVEHADVIVLNRSELLDPDMRERVVAACRALNQSAEMIETADGIVVPGRLLGSPLFSDEVTSARAGWLHVMKRGTLETVPAGITSFAFRSDRPFHPTRFREFLEDPVWRAVLRAKGIIWLATRHELGLGFSLAGGSCRIDSAGRWWASVSQSDWPLDAETSARVRAQWNGPYGDRRQELAVIAERLDVDGFVARANACLLTDDELDDGPERWASLADPFPSTGD